QVAAPRPLHRAGGGPTAVPPSSAAPTGATTVGAVNRKRHTNIATSTTMPMMSVIRPPSMSSTDVASKMTRAYQGSRPFIQFMMAEVISHTPRPAVIELRMIWAVEPSSSSAGLSAKKNGTMNDGMAILNDAQPVRLKSLPAIEAAAYDASATGGVIAASTPK